MSKESWDDIEERLSPALNALYAELEKIYPDLFSIEYEKGGDVWTFKDRMLMTLWWELMFAFDWNIPD